MSAIAYCTPAQVTELLRLPAAFSSTTNPTKETVQNIIHRKMALIDYKIKASFRTQQVQEYHNIEGYYERLTGVSVYLHRRNIETPLSASYGDSLKIFNGSDWEEFVGSKTEGRSDDFWFDEEMGVLFLKTSYRNRRLGVNITYRFNSGASTTISGATATTDSTIYASSTTRFPYQGVITISGEKILYNSKNAFGFEIAERGAFNTTAEALLGTETISFVPEDISECCTKMAAIDVLNSDDWSSGGTTTGEMPSGQSSISEKINKWQKDIETIFDRYTPTIVP